jgi:hypothetical protein
LLVITNTPLAKIDAIVNNGVTGTLPHHSTYLQIFSDVVVKEGTFKTKLHHKLISLTQAKANIFEIIKC